MYFDLDTQKCIRHKRDQSNKHDTTRLNMFFFLILIRIRENRRSRVFFVMLGRVCMRVCDFSFISRTRRNWSHGGTLSQEWSWCLENQSVGATIYTKTETEISTKNGHSQTKQKHTQPIRHILNTQKSIYLYTSKATKQ